MKWSKYQKRIFKEYENSNDNLIISAVPGAGKTTTILELARKERHPLFLAFNKRVAQYINKKMGQNIASTIHSFCFKSIRKAGKFTVNENKYLEIALDMDYKKHAYAIQHMASKMRLLNYSIEEIAKNTYLDIEYGIGFARALANVIQEGRKKMLYNGYGIKEIDFTDMLELALLEGNISVARDVDVVFIDECQDLSPMHLEIIEKFFSNKRIIAVGDPRQSIYGFAGADTQAFYRLKERFNMKELPLHICYRCGSEIIDLVNVIAKQYDMGIRIEPYWNGGLVQSIALNDMFDMVKEKLDEDVVILTRRKSTAVSCNIQLIKQGIPAHILGKDLSKEVINTIDKIYQFAEENEDDDFFCLLEDYKRYISRRLYRKPAKLENIKDNIEAIRVLYDYLSPRNIVDFKQKVKAFFAGTSGIPVSTIHRIKGLEFDTVFILEFYSMPLQWKRQTTEEYQQEVNVLYVALTRAKENLYLVKMLDETR